MQTKTRRILITAAIVTGFGAALSFALRDQQQAIQSGAAAPAMVGTAPAAAASLKGLVALDVEGYFQDPRVQRILKDNRINVSVQRVGSRDMAQKVSASDAPDFFMSSGVVAANQITEASRTVNAQRKVSFAATQSAPFFSPMVIASWEPVAKILMSNGVAKAVSPKVYTVDMAKLTEMMLARKRWKELAGSGEYSVGRSVLVSTTDLRRSNSGALYLALTSAAMTGDVVSDRETAARSAQRLAELFKRQGYQENYVDGNFDDYTGQGMGKSPMAFVYEFQMIRYALARKAAGAAMDSQMVLMYPSPTILNKEVFVAMNEQAKALGTLLATDVQLQAIAIEHGFRVADAQKFADAVKPTGLAIQPRVADVVDPPAADLMAEMIDIVSKEMTK